MLIFFYSFLIDCHLKCFAQMNGQKKTIYIVFTYFIPCHETDDNEIRAR